MAAGRQDIREWVAEAGPLSALPDMDSGARIVGVAAPENARQDTLVFATSQAALREALASRAGMILAQADLPFEDDPRILRVRDARLAFALAAAALKEKTQEGIHATAFVDAAAEIAGDVCVGAGSVIGAAVRMGAGCVLGARVVVEPGVVLGKKVIVQAGAVLGSTGFGYARRPSGAYVLFPQVGSLVIEDDVEIGANTTIDRGTLGETRIGAGTKIDNLVHIGHNCRIGQHVIIAAQTGISGSTVVEDGAILGGQVGIGEHALVGRGVVLGGGAGVLSGKKLRGAGQVFWGRPAQPLKQYLRDLARLRKG